MLIILCNCLVPVYRKILLDLKIVSLVMLLVFVFLRIKFCNSSSISVGELGVTCI